MDYGIEQSWLSAAAPPLMCRVTSGRHLTSGSLGSYLYAGRDDGDLPWGVVRIERGETHKALSTMPGTHSVFTKRELLSFGLEFREDWSVSVV